MDKQIPRRQVDELITRWKLAKLPLVVVEGPSDRRFLNLLQKKDFCEAVLKDLDVWPIEYVEMPADIVKKHGFVGTGSKQRVVSLGREIEFHGCVEGFRAIVDKDLDPFLQIDLQSKNVFYTDPCSMEGYSWSLSSLGRVVEFYKCEKSISTPAKMVELFDSINGVCAELSAIRLASFRNQELEAVLHHSDKSLRLQGCKVILDTSLYLEQCNPKKGSLPIFVEAAAKVKMELVGTSSLDLIHGHDLLWVLLFSLKQLTELPKRTIDAELVAASLTASGAMDADLVNQPMFKAITGWAAGL